MDKENKVTITTPDKRTFELTEDEWNGIVVLITLKWASTDPIKSEHALMEGILREIWGRWGRP